MLCQFAPTDKPNVYRCIRCGWVTPPVKSRPERVFKECAATRKPWPVWRFAKALVRHSLDLFRRRLPWEIEELHNICKACPHYRPKKEEPTRTWWQRLLRITPADGVCLKCGGCPLASGKRWRNKLAWRSEQCPIGKWHATTLWGSLFRRLARWINNLRRNHGQEENREETAAGEAQAPSEASPDQISPAQAARPDAGRN